MTVLKFRIRRSNWRKLAQSKLPPYANNVVNRTQGKEAYSPIADRVSNLSTKSKALSNILDKGPSRGELAQKQKKIAITELYEALESVAIGLEDNAPNELYILEAGMELQHGSTRHDGELLALTKVVAVSNGQKGQAIVQFTCPPEQRTQVQTFNVSWSDDGKQTWHEGVYKNAKRILVTGLPNRKDIHFRVRCIGTNGRTSNWSDSAETFVL